MKIPDTILAAIERTRIETPWKQRTPFIAMEAGRLGVSSDTIYRQLRTYRKGRVKESPQPRTYDTAHVEEIMRRKIDGYQFGTIDREIPTHILRQQLIDEGVGEEQIPSVTRINDILRHEMLMREGRTYVRIEASCANEQAQLDHSRCKHFQIKDWDSKRGDWLLTVQSESLAYKQDNTQLRTWYTNYVDRFSRLFVPRIVAASGESITVGLEHLDFVFNRDADANPVSYLPASLQTDRGSLNRSQPYTRALEALEIDKGTSHSKEANGMVERRFRSIWTGFELPLAQKMGKGQTIWLSDLNAMLMEYAVAEGQRAHPVHGHLSRQEAYLQSMLSHRPREIDVSVLRVACRVEERKVGPDGTISLPGARWFVPQYVKQDGRPIPTRGQRLRVWASASGEVVAELIAQYCKPFRLEPWAPNALGDYSRRTAPTTRERVEAELQHERDQAKHDRKRQRAAAQSTQHGPIRIAPLLPDTDLVDADSPIIRSPQREQVTEDRSHLMTEHETRLYIGKRLAAEGRYIADYPTVFTPLLSQSGGIQRTDADRLITAVLDRVRKAA